MQIQDFDKFLEILYFSLNEKNRTENKQWYQCEWQQSTSNRLLFEETIGEWIR